MTRDNYIASLVQLSLHEQGLYSGKVDGEWGPKTEAGFQSYITANSKFKPSLISEAYTKIAESQIGVRESGNNGGDKIREYQKSTSLEPESWPWCAAFVCWCFHQAILVTPAMIIRPKSAAVSGFVDWAKDQKNAGVKVFEGSIEPIRRGDIVLFHFPTGNHIGICSGSQDGGNSFETIEGNTGISGSVGTASDRDGDGVYRKGRNTRYVTHVIRV